MGRGNRNWIGGAVAILLVLGAIERGWAQTRSSTLGIVQGWVVDTTGAAVRGVRVRLSRGTYEDAFSSYPLVSVGEAAARADGSFSFSTLPGEYTLQLAPPGDQLAPWVAEPVSLRLTSGEPLVTRLVVRSGGVCTVALAEDTSHRPLVRARVNIREVGSLAGALSITSGIDGLARIRLLPGSYEIESVLCDGYTYDGQRRAFTLEENETRNVALFLTPNVRGVVRDTYGLPVAGARVRIVGAGREEATSDEQGRFEIGWERRFQFRDALTFCLVAQHERRNLATTMTISRDATWLDVPLQACPVLAGRLTDLNGQGLAGASAYVTLRVPDWGDTPLSEEVTETGADGRFEIPAVPTNGLCTLHVYAAGHGSRDTVVPIRAADGLSFDVGTLTLLPANLSVSGRILDSQGNPLANARISGWGEGQPLKLNAETDAQGRFTIDGVCPGQVNLRIDVDLGDGKHLQIQTLVNAGAIGLEIRPREPYSRVSQGK